MKTYYVDGRFVPANQAVIPVDDLAVLRGYGVCDIMRTYNGRPFFLNEHIKRLRHSADQIGLTLPWDENRIKEIVLETIEKNFNGSLSGGGGPDDGDMEEANIRIVITGGSSPDFLNPTGRPRLIVLVTPITKLPEKWYTDGAKIITVERERSIPGAKVTSYVPAALALKKAKTVGAMEALYVNSAGEALECTTSNLFAFFGNCLVTAGSGILKGITRELIMTLGADMFEIKEEKLLLKDLLKADEVFITGTNKGVVPVVQIDDTVIKNGRPGKNTIKILNALNRHAEEFSKS